MADWEQDFDFYETAVEGKRAFVALDLAARRSAPLATHPHRLVVRTRMLNPRPDGLRSSEEAQALFDLEDAIVAALTASGFVHVGRVLYEGTTAFAFYAPERIEEGALRETVGDRSPYVLDFIQSHDPDWRYYIEFLWPDPYAMQSIQNRRLMDVRAQHEDRPELEREVDHLAFFPDEPRAAQAAAALAKLGYRVDPLREQEEEDGTKRWAVEFHRDDHLDEDRPNEITREILDIILPLDGDYDGWGAVIAK